MESIQILHIASGRQWRGGEQQVLHLVSGLSELAGLRSTVLTSRSGELARRLAQESLPVRTVPWRAGVDPRALPGMIGAVGSVGLVHVHDGHAFDLFRLARRLARWSGPVVVTRRVTFPVRAAKWKPVQRVIAVSDSVRRVLVRCGVPESRVAVIPPAIDLRNIPNAKTSLLHRLVGIPAHVPILLVVGALTREKGHALALHAGRRVRAAGSDAQWVFLGAGPDQARLEREIRRAGLQGTVHLAGWRPDVSSLVHDATLLVVPSLQEGFGGAVLDGLAAGVPIVASDAGGIPEALAGGGGMTVPAGNATRLAEAILDLLADPNRRAALGDAGRRAVRRFDRPRLVDAHLSVYRSLIVPDPGPEALEGT